MSGFRMISSFVRELQPRLVELPEGDLRTRAGGLALSTWGQVWVLQQPATINIAALAIQMGNRLELTQVRPGAANLVHATDLHSLPSEPPRLLRGQAALLEVRQPEKGERLFGETVALGAYRLDEAWYLVGLDYPDGIYGARWAPVWEDGELELPVQDSPLIRCDPGQHQAWTEEAARFLVVLGMLLDAEGAPLREEVDRPGKKGKGAPGASAGREWTTRHLYLDDRRSPTATSSPGTSPTPAAGLSEEQVRVRGHLKRQPHGPGGQLRKLIWVEAFEARRWVAPRPRLTVVH